MPASEAVDLDRLEALNKAAEMARLSEKDNPQKIEALKKQISDAETTSDNPKEKVEYSDEAIKIGDDILKEEFGPPSFKGILQGAIDGFGDALKRRGDQSTQEGRDFVEKRNVLRKAGPEKLGEILSYIKEKRDAIFNDDKEREKYETSGKGPKIHIPEWLSDIFFFHSLFK
jgi:hypothetical protein